MPPAAGSGSRARPINVQDIARVDHPLSPDDLTGVAGDVESVVLARAVHWLVQHRVLTDGQNTVLFE